MSKIFGLLEGFIASILCRTMSRIAINKSRESGNMTALEAYHYIVKEKMAALDTNEGMHKHIEDFSMYCASDGQHMTYEELLKNVNSAFCTVGVIKQLGPQRNQSVARGIFSKTFKEAANIIVRMPSVMDMVANGAANAEIPCRNIAKSAIEAVQLNLLSEEIGTTDRQVAGPTVSARMYESLRQKYDSIVNAYNKQTVDLDKSIGMIKKLTGELNRSLMECKSFKTRLFEIESRPRELTFGNDICDEHRDHLDNSKDDLDDSVSMISSSKKLDKPDKPDKQDKLDKPEQKIVLPEKSARIKGSFIGALEPKSSGSVVSAAKIPSSEIVPMPIVDDDVKSSASSSKSSSKKKRKPAESTDDFDPDEFNSFF